MSYGKNERADACGRKCLARLAEVLAILEPSTVERDAGIQRFEFTLAAKSFLYEVEGLDMGSPKSAIRACREVGF